MGGLMNIQQGGGEKKIMFTSFLMYSYSGWMLPRLFVVK